MPAVEIMSHESSSEDQAYGHYWRPSTTTTTPAHRRILTIDRSTRLQSRRNDNNSSPKPTGAYDVAIPSYQRASAITQAALPFLLGQGVPLHRIFVFVANADEASEYLRTLSQVGEWKLTSRWSPDDDRTSDVGHIVVGTVGIRKQRNRIMLFFPEGRHVVSCDDDVKTLLCKTSSEHKCEPLAAGELDLIIRDAENNMLAYGCYLWGLNPCSNTMYKKTSGIMTGAGLVNANFHGVIIRHDRCLKRRIGDTVEDQEMSLRWFHRDGMVLRYKMLSSKQRYYAAGGLDACYSKKDRLRLSRLEKQQLVDAFPSLTNGGTKRVCVIKQLRPLPSVGTTAVWTPPSERSHRRRLIQDSTSTYSIYVTDPTGHREEIQTAPSTTICEFFHKVSVKTNISVADMKLSYVGQELRSGDDKSLSERGIGNHASIDMRRSIHVCLRPAADASRTRARTNSPQRGKKVRRTCRHSEGPAKFTYDGWRVVASSG